MEGVTANSDNPTSTPPWPAQRARRTHEVRERPASIYLLSHPVHWIACCVLSLPCVFVACCGIGRMLHLVCGVCARLCRVAHWLSSAMLRACCKLCAARCSSHTKCGSAVCVLWHLACARVLLHVVCCLLHVVCCMRCLVVAIFCALSAACRMLPCCPLPVALLPVVRCTPSVVFSTLFVVYCMLPAARCMLRCMSWLLAACCLQSGACCMLPVSRCMLCVMVACRPLHGACCLSVARGVSSGAFFPVHVACRLLSVAHFPVVPCTLSLACRLRHCCPLDRVCVPFLCCMSHVLRCMWSVFGYPPRFPMLHAACCLSPGPTSHLLTLHALRCASSIACCKPHAPCCMLSLGRCLSHSSMLPAACRLLPVAE